MTSKEQSLELTTKAVNKWIFDSRNEEQGNANEFLAAAVQSKSVPEETGCRFISLTVDTRFSTYRVAYVLEMENDGASFSEASAALEEWLRNEINDGLGKEFAATAFQFSVKEGHPGIYYKMNDELRTIYLKREGSFAGVALEGHCSRVLSK